MTSSRTRADKTRRSQVAAWAMWDFGSAAFNAVLVTFIFSVYLVDSVGANISGLFTSAQYLSVALAAAGLAIAGITPIMGQRSDINGTRRRALGTWTFITVALMAALVLVRNDADWYFFLGLLLLTLGTVTFEFAEVNYFAQLSQISTPATVGRVSGFGWAAGYGGGIILLLLCYFGFVSGTGDTRGFLGVPVEGGLNIRLVALFAALWFALSALPVLFTVPEISPSGEKAGTVGDSYRRLIRELKELWHADRRAVRFLLASAVFRDGLAGVFTYGAILGVSVYGLAPADVLIFGVAANVAAALGAVIGGLIDDRIGPKPVILGSLIALVAVAVGLFFARGAQAFWILGLFLCLFVGPAQSSSRSFLTRIIPEGREGQMFGFYATTGRAASWLSPIAFFIMVSLGGGNDRWGVLGIGLVLLVGAALLAGVRDAKPMPTAR